MPTYQDWKDRRLFIPFFCQNQGLERGSPFSYSKADALPPYSVPGRAALKEPPSAKTFYGLVQNWTELHLTDCLFFFPPRKTFEGIKAPSYTSDSSFPPIYRHPVRCSETLNKEIGGVNDSPGATTIGPARNAIRNRAILVARNMASAKMVLACVVKDGTEDTAPYVSRIFANFVESNFGSFCVNGLKSSW